MQHLQNQPGKSDESNSETEQPEVESNQDSRPAETGGPKGLEPTRYGDWERKGRCIDF